MAESFHSPAPHTAPAADVISHMRSAPSGLSDAEANLRLEQFGPNTLRRTKKIQPLKIFLRQFSSFIIWVLLGAGSISVLLGELVDSAAIFAIVIINACIGFFQEYRAENALEALKKLTSPQARVRRNGETRVIDSSQIVPGDVIDLEAGDLIPADGRIYASSELSANEASLTGESVPVVKSAEALHEMSTPLADRSNMVFMGSAIAAGSGSIVITASGMETEMGKIAGMIENAPDERTPLQKNLDDVGRVLVWISFGIVGVIFALGLLRGMPLLDIFLVSVSLAVAAVPEGIPAIVTAALALGVQRMAKKKALVRHLPAVETLGSTNIICTDKTGTLTLGQMTVRSVYIDEKFFSVSGEGYGPRGEITLFGRGLPAEEKNLLSRLFDIFEGCSTAEILHSEGVYTVAGDPTEGALIAASRKIDRNPPGSTTQTIVRTFPFDSGRKRMSVVQRHSNGYLSIVKGAPDIILDRSTKILTSAGVRKMEESDRKAIITALSEMTSKSLRVLGGAYRESEVPFSGMEDAESDLIFAGFAGMYDPPRAEAIEAVKNCLSAGIQVIMITGDHPETALSIATEMGIAGKDDRVITGVELDQLDETALREAAPDTKVFARVNPEHKLRIVKIWKELGGIVAMTGDGVNDAPAIKRADAGIAMGESGTEVTKEASDIVITDDNFASIVAAVEEGRGIYNNIRKTLLYLLAGNSAELFIMFVAMLFALPVPLLPVHLLWINLVTDGLPALALAVDRADPGLMKFSPRASGEKIMNKDFYMTMIFSGTLVSIPTLAVYIYTLRSSGIEEARTYTFTLLVFIELIKSFAFLHLTEGFWKSPAVSILRISLIATLSAGIQIAALLFLPLQKIFRTSPIPPEKIALLLFLAVLPSVGLELFKRIRSKFRRSSAA